MVERPIAMAAAAMDGTLLSGDGAALWSGAAIDSRNLRGGELFFALPGEHTDGHRFATAAARDGAAGVVVHQDLEPGDGGSAWIRVADTYDALHALTRAVRREVPRHLVGITGSAGKTTTKEILAAMLAQRFRTARSPGNFNNLYGFPLALLAVPDDCEMMVAEMGMSVPGELGQVSRLGRPDAVVYTNVRPVHLESFPNLRGIAEAKAELLEGLADGGLAVVNADDPEVMGLVERHLASSGGGRARLVRYGVEAAEVEVRGSAPEPLEGRPGCRFRITAAGESVDVELGLHGLYNAWNCLAAAACAHALGVPLADIATAARELRSSDHRGVVHHLAGGVTLIDDCYNSNPDAAVRALESARVLGRGAQGFTPLEPTAQPSRHLAILGDMLELGPDSPTFHREVGKAAADLGFSPILGVGPLAAQLVDAARDAGADAVHLPDAEAAATWAREHVNAGDLVLVKGSRGIGLEVVVDALVQAHGEGDS